MKDELYLEIYKRYAKLLEDELLKWSLQFRNNPQIFKRVLKYLWLSAADEVLNGKEKT